MTTRKIPPFRITVFVFFPVLCMLIGVPADAYNLVIKKRGERAWSGSPDTISAMQGDTLANHDPGQGAAVLYDSIRLLLKDSAAIAFDVTEKTISLTLLNGQACIDKRGNYYGIEFEFRARGCRFCLLGTMAVLKISRDGNPSVAVLNGTVRMIKPGGVTTDIPAGTYCTYMVETNAFTPERPLSSKAMTALIDWMKKGFILMQQAQASQPPPEIDSGTADVRSDKQNPVPDPPAAQKSNTMQRTENGQAQPAKVAATDSTKPGAGDGAQKSGSAQDDGNASHLVKEVSAGVLSVGQEQWTRLALALDVPLWRFGVCFDIELFLNAQGNVARKGWEFNSRDNAVESVLRKIRYIRYNKPQDNVFVTIGGLESVTLGYGFIVDRFTNMLRYPDAKLLGLQASLHGVIPLNTSLEMVAPDVKEFAHGGGIFAGRLGFQPLHMLPVPVVNGLTAAFTGAVDVNQYAPARTWRVEGDWRDKNGNGVFDRDYFVTKGYSSPVIDSLIKHGDCDTNTFTIDTTYRDSTEMVALCGGDISIPLLTTDFLGLDLYGQAAITVDDETPEYINKGLGIGAPGLALRIGPVSGRMEYRYCKDRFKPGFFDTYYYEDRLRRNPVTVKERTLPPFTGRQQGIFGTLTCSIKGFAVMEGSGQYLMIDDESKGCADRWCNASLAIGEQVVRLVPRIRSASVFYHQSRIRQNLFKKSEFTYWGYMLRVSVVPNTAIVWETRFGWKATPQKSLEATKTVNLSAGLSF